MAIKYTWTYGPMRVEYVNGFQDVVTGLYWACKCEDEDNYPTVNSFDSGIMQLPTIDQENFIPFESVTPEIVNGWISTSINKQEIENKCLQEFNLQANPPVRYVDVPVGLNPPVSSMLTGEDNTLITGAVNMPDPVIPDNPPDGAKT